MRESIIKKFKNKGPLIIASIVFIFAAISLQRSTASAVTFNYTGSMQTYTVPSTGTYKMEVWGAQGGGSGGKGAYAYGEMNLTEGQTVYIYTGGKGGGYSGLIGGAGGFNGGGAGGNGTSQLSYIGGNGGGGASDIRIGGTSLTNRVIVAGGGGGERNGGAGGITGGDGASSWWISGPSADDTSTTWWTSGYYSNGGRGATQSSGGNGGTTSGNGGTNAANGVLGVGGAGSNATYGDGGAGGGGGYYGGGGGASGGYMTGGFGQGGGGSSYVGTLQNSGITAGVQVGDGLVAVTSLLPPAGSVSAISGGLMDVSNNNNPSDIRVMFRGAADETKIQEYRVIASKAVLDANTAAGLGTASYAVEPIKGRGRLHLFTLPSGLKDNAGNSITKDTGSYTIYILSYAKTGAVHSIASSGTIGLDPNVPLTGLAAPIISDIANIGDSSDFRVTFKGTKVESDIQEYRILVWNTSAPAFDLTAANAVSGVNRYKAVTVGSGNKNGYTVTLPAGMLDTRGGANTVANGQSYKIYILAVMNKTGTGNILSSPSKVITLLSTVPSAAPVRDLTAVKVGSGHMGSNISVTFSEPLTVGNVQEYRVFISPDTGLLDSVTAAGLSNTRYIKGDSTGRGTSHTVILTGLNNIYDGTALGAGDYKVYVLTVGKTSTYAGKLTGPSRIVKLD